MNLQPTSLSFSVDRTGVPILVRMSWAPGWRVSGATSIERAAPNFFVVVPTEKNVRITMSRTASEHAGNALSALGIVALGGLAVADRRRRNESPASVTSYSPAESDVAAHLPGAMAHTAATEDVDVTAADLASTDALVESTDQRA